MAMTSATAPRMCVMASSTSAMRKPAMLRSENGRFDTAKSAVSRAMLNVRSRIGMAGRFDRGSKSARSTVTNLSSAMRRRVTFGFSNARITFSAPAATKGSYVGVRITHAASPTRKPASALSAVCHSSRGNACAPNEEEADRRENDDDLPDGGVEEVEEARVICAEEVERDDAYG